MEHELKLGLTVKTATKTAVQKCRSQFGSADRSVEMLVMLVI